MFWNKKEDKKGMLPELPPLRMNLSKPEIQSPRLPAYPPIEEESEAPVEKTKLPAFPESPAHDKFSQIAIKEAIKGPEQPPKSFIREETESQEWAPSFPEEKEETNVQREEAPKIEMPKKEEKKEVFVKIDKFRTAKKAMELVSKNLTEMENLIRKIRDTKMREDQEFSNWERDIESVKLRVSSIREDIFESLD